MRELESPSFFCRKIINDNVIKNDVFQQKNERIMAEKRRIWFPGAIYHLMHRGVRENCNMCLRDDINPVW